MNIFEWLQAHWQELVAAYTALVTLASIIVKLTPTLSDDNALLAVIKFVSKFLALNRTANDDEIRKAE